MPNIHVVATNNIWIDIVRGLQKHWHQSLLPRRRGRDIGVLKKLVQKI